MYHVYIIANHKGNLYTGHTKNLKQRIHQHNQGQVKFTASGAPWVLVYKEEKDTKEEVLTRELQIKKWSRIKKINLIKHGHPTKF
jgi:predicted GIY-YIG superfamily endonuclease